jgi:hypothetical protein
MAVTLSGNLNLLWSILDQRTAVTGAANESGSRSISLGSTITIVSGTAAGQVDKVWSDTRVVTTGATDSIDLAGTLTDSFSAVTTFVKVRAILAVAAGANTTTLSAARPAANGSIVFAAASDQIAGVSFGGIIFAWADLQAGVAVAAGTTDLFSVINSAGASATYSIAVLGTSA